MSFGRSGSGYSGLAPRSLGGPRAGAFRTRPRSMLTRVTSRDSILRHMDWSLIAAVVALSVLGVLLVWSATEPTLAKQGLTTRTSLATQAAYFVLALTITFPVTALDYRHPT